MNFRFKPKLKPKLKPKPKLKQLLALMLIAITITTSLPLTTLAYNGDKANGVIGTSMQLIGGPSESKTGILLYIVEQKTGTPLTNSGLVTPVDVRGIKSRFVISKLGNLSYGAYLVLDNMPKPVIWTGSSWSPNGTAVKAWLLAEGEGRAEGGPRWEYIVSELFGSGSLTTIKQNPNKYSIVVEPVAWMNIYIDNEGYYLKDHNGLFFEPTLATATAWARYYRGVGQPTGDDYTQKMTHQALPASMVLEEARFGLAPHAGETMSRLDSTAIETSGWGIHIIDLEGPKIKTYLAENGSPGDPEPPDPPKDGVCNIVKGYYEENTVTGEKESLGVYYTEECTNNVEICIEPGFTIEEWEVTTAHSTGIDPTTWNIPGSVTQRGTGGNETIYIDPDKGEKTVYVRLKTTITPPPETDADASFTLNQSQITKTVLLSESELNDAARKVTKLKPVWLHTAHQNTCRGHVCSNPSTCPTGTYGTCVGTCGICAATCQTDHNGDTAGKGHQTTHGAGCPSLTKTCGLHKCTWGKWSLRTLTTSLENSQKNAHPDILATKSGQESIVSNDGSTQMTKQLKRTSHKGGTQKGKSGWDVVCVLMRGKDKLTVAKWVNDGQGVPAATTANTDLKDLSSSGFAIADKLDGNRQRMNQGDMSEHGEGYNESFSGTSRVLFFCSLLPKMLKLPFFLIISMYI